MQLFDVTVDDPDMKCAHRYQLEAEGRAEARLMAARRAIADDEIGAVPKGNDEGVARVIAEELSLAIAVADLRVH